MLKSLGTVAAMSVLATTVVTAPVEAATRVAAPRALHAVSATPTTMTLDWRSLSRAASYRVKISTHRDMSNARTRHFVRSTGVVRHLRPAKRYYFRVAALRANRTRLSRYTVRSFPSARTDAVATPTRLAATATSPTSVDMSWRAAEGATGYRLAASTSADFSSPILLRSTRPSITVTGLDSDTRYYFKVRVVNPDGTGLTTYSSPAPAATEPQPVAEAPAPVVNGPSDVRAGSYNVQSVSLDTTSGEQRPWRERRAGVLANILGENLDVIGLQEANAGSSFKSRLVDGDTQYADIRNGLVSGGQNFQVTNTAAANCVNAATTYNCVARDRGAAGSDRILYNTDRLSMVSQGGYAFRTQDAGGTPRNMAYAVLQVKRTGDRFLFVTTHLEAHSATVRYAQWRELIAKVATLKGSLPVIAVGDYNMNRSDANSAQMLPMMKSAGMGDVLNQQYGATTSHPRALRTVNGWINTVNHMNRDVSTFSYEDRRTQLGFNIDYVFASNALVVKEWKVVLDFDPTTLRVNGVIPSDHNMVRATVTIP